MHIRIKENRLKQIIKESVKEYITENYMFVNSYLSNRQFRILTEGLTMTYAPQRVINIINNKFDLKNIGGKIRWFDRTYSTHPISKQQPTFGKEAKSTDDYNRLIEIQIFFQRGLKNATVGILNEIIHTFETCGWIFASIQDMSDLKEYKNVNDCDFDSSMPHNMYFRPKFDQEVKNYVIPDVCYHICPLHLVNKIMRQGLKPKDYGRTSNHPERVYLFYNYPTDWQETIAQRFKESRATEKYALLRIDVDRWITDSEKRGNAPKFRFDSLTMGKNNEAIYTLESIPPQYITIIDVE